MEILTNYLEQIEELATKENVSDTLRTLISKASKLAAGKTNGEFNSNYNIFDSVRIYQDMPCLVLHMNVTSTTALNDFQTQPKQAI